MNVELFDGDYILQIYDDLMYTLNSTDNKYIYDNEYYDRSLANHHFLSKCGLSIMKDGDVLKSAIVMSSGGPTRVHPKSFVIDDSSLIIIVGNKASCLSIPDLVLDWQTECDYACCFGIYRFSGDFLVNGELEITRIDKSGNIKWQFSGADIFVDPEGEDCLFISNDRIKVRDWNGDSYLLDSDGKPVV
ncbi:MULTISPECIES: hypothetical protein [unclassified Dehalobacter]|uniref:hypothetical protein n=1 Tax=unclassified Dehalobacter TaxID=2635733 RepID=UPI000ED89F94|nr:MULTISPECIES: hypothetical protein [unclassified Dehalobacter]RJE47010.1 hypothetical protein A7K50_04910 [Dehalobacter sp. MCB1]TCX54617.1 hypothetical protein C1I38_05375 [Dehalobacter sp. 12DCB1]